MYFDQGIHKHSAFNYRSYSSGMWEAAGEEEIILFLVVHFAGDKRSTVIVSDSQWVPSHVSFGIFSGWLLVKKCDTIYIFMFQNCIY